MFRVILGNRQNSFEEISLHCDERPSDLITSSDEKSNKPPIVVSEVKLSPPQIERNYSLDSQNIVTPSSNILINEKTVRRKEDVLGTIVWVDGEGFPCWPAKVVSEPRPNKSSLQDDQVPMVFITPFSLFDIIKIFGSEEFLFSVKVLLMKKANLHSIRQIIVKN